MLAKIWIMLCIEVEGSITATTTQVFANEDEARSAFKTQCNYLKNDYDCTQERKYNFDELIGVEEDYWGEDDNFFEIKRLEGLCHITCSLESHSVNYEELIIE